MIFNREKNNIDIIIKKCLDIDELLSSRTSRMKKSSIFSKIFKSKLNEQGTEKNKIGIEDSAENIVEWIQQKVHQEAHIEKD